MTTQELHKLVLLAEDDDDHYFLIQSAFNGSKLAERLFRLSNGVELMDYLLKKGKFAKFPDHQLPVMIILDLNLPKKDGRQVLKEIITYPHLKNIPIAILTTSINEEDRINSTNLGAKFFFKKPIFFKEYVEIIKTLKNCWSENAGS